VLSGGDLADHTHTHTHTHTGFKSGGYFDRLNTALNIASDISAASTEGRSSFRDAVRESAVTPGLATVECDGFITAVAAEDGSTPSP